LVVPRGCPGTHPFRFPLPDHFLISKDPDHAAAPAIQPVMALLERRSSIAYSLMPPKLVIVAHLVR
jgi:hypothetical protein